MSKFEKYFTEIKLNWSGEKIERSERDRESDSDVGI